MGYGRGYVVSWRALCDLRQKSVAGYGMWRRTGRRYGVPAVLPAHGGVMDGHVFPYDGHAPPPGPAAALVVLVLGLVAYARFWSTF